MQYTQIIEKKIIICCLENWNELSVLTAFLFNLGFDLKQINLKSFKVVRSRYPGKDRVKKRLRAT